MAVPPYMSDKIADHYASTGQTELAAQQRESSENVGKARQSHGTAKKSRFQALSKCCPYITPTSMRIGVLVAIVVGVSVLVFQRTHMGLGAFVELGDQFKKEELTKATEKMEKMEKVGEVVIPSAATALVKEEGVKNEINTAGFFGDFFKNFQWMPSDCPHRFRPIESEEELTKETERMGDMVIRCVSPALLKKEGVEDRIYIQDFMWWDEKRHSRINKTCPETRITTKDELLKFSREKDTTKSFAMRCADLNFALNNTALVDQELEAVMPYIGKYSAQLREKIRTTWIERRCGANSDSVAQAHPTVEDPPKIPQRSILYEFVLAIIKASKG